MQAPCSLFFHKKRCVSKRCFNFNVMSIKHVPLEYLHLIFEDLSVEHQEFLLAKTTLPKHFDENENFPLHKLESE